MPKVVITGVNGFVGKHLVSELLKSNYSILGIGGPNTKTYSDNNIEYVSVDLTEEDSLSGVSFKNVDYVINLAGLASVAPSFEAPLLYLNTNLAITVTLFEECIKQDVYPKLLTVSSGALYGPSSDLPLTENSDIVPSSPYSVSKIGQEYLTKYYGLRGFKYIIARPFNHIGPGQDEGFILPDLAKQFVGLEKGSFKEIMVGNLEAGRDYTDVRDIVRAYRLLLEKGRSGEIYNICSGKATSGQRLLDELLGESLSKTKVVKDPAKVRPVDNPIIYASHEKLTKDTGWRPEIDIQTTIKDVLQDWRNKA